MLTRSRYNVAVRLNKDLERAVERAVNMYNFLRQQHLLPCSDHDVWHCGIISDVDSDGVTIDWETSWSYGGYDRGSHDIPLDALIDGTYIEYITEKVKNEAAQFKKQQKAMERAERAAKLKQFNTLAKELGK